MQSWWKNPRIVGDLAYYVLVALRFTLRVKVEIHPQVDPNKPYLLSLWHGQQLLPVLLLAKRHNTPKVAMVSPSRDGAMLSVFLEKLGYEVIRGSSRDNNISALLQTKERVEQGASIGFAIDGPIGPIHVIKPGIAYLAEKCQVPIVPVGCAFGKHWVFNKAWDKFQLPKPFSKAVLVLGQPFLVPPGMEPKETCLHLEKLMQHVEQQARVIMHRS